MHSAGSVELTVRSARSRQRSAHKCIALAVSSFTAELMTTRWRPYMNASQWGSRRESAMFPRKRFGRSASSLAFRRGRSRGDCRHRS